MTQSTIVQFETGRQLREKLLALRRFRRRKSVDRRFDAPKGGGSATLEILGAFTHKHGDAKIDLEVEVEYLFEEPIPFRLRSDGKSECVFYPGVPVRLGFELASVPPKAPDGWQPYAIELNLRKGGTTHPFLTLQFLTDGVYDQQSHEFRIADQKKCYVATDALVSESYRVFTPDDLFDK